MEGKINANSSEQDQSALFCNKSCHPHRHQKHCDRKQNRSKRIQSSTLCSHHGCGLVKRSQCLCRSPTVDEEDEAQREYQRGIGICNAILSGTPTIGISTASPITGPGGSQDPRGNSSGHLGKHSTPVCFSPRDQLCPSHETAPLTPKSCRIVELEHIVVQQQIKEYRLLRALQNSSKVASGYGHAELQTPKTRKIKQLEQKLSQLSTPKTLKIKQLELKLSEDIVKQNRSSHRNQENEDSNCTTPNRSISSAPPSRLL